MDDRQLRTTWLNRQRPDRVSHLSEPLTSFMKKTLARRVRQLSRIAEVWDAILPPEVRDHTALESFSRGTLTVVVDSAAHRFELQTLLRGGLQRELGRQCPEAINKIRLVPGQFSSVDLNGESRYEF